MHLKKMFFVMLQRRSKNKLFGFNHNYLIINQLNASFLTNIFYKIDDNHFFKLKFLL